MTVEDDDDQAASPGRQRKIIATATAPSMASNARESKATTSPLLRAFKDARKNYWVRTAAGDLSYYTAIRIPQATENNKLKHKAREGIR